MPLAIIVPMNLSDIYDQEGIDGLRRLAKATGADAQYLRQCATHWRKKRPSPELAAKLIAADSRLTWEDLYKPAVESAA
jgi:hypothetical protein